MAETEEIKRPKVNLSRNIILAILALFLIFESGYFIFRFGNKKTSSEPVEEETEKKEVPRTAILSLDPAEGSFKVGEAFKVKIIIDTKEYETDAVDVRLKFDPKVLKVEKIEQGKIYDDYPAKRVDTEAGVIVVNGITNLTRVFKGKDVFAELNFKGLKVGRSDLVFEFIPASTVDSNVVAAKIAKDVLGEVEGAGIEITK